VKHVLSFDAEDPGGLLVWGGATKRLQTMKLDRVFTVESLVVLCPYFFLLTLELEGHHTAHFGRALLSPEAVGKPLPMPAFVIEPGRRAVLTIVNWMAEQKHFGGYLFGNLEVA
jgi:hypothetical protein